MWHSVPNMCMISVNLGITNITYRYTSSSFVGVWAVLQCMDMEYEYVSNESGKLHTSLVVNKLGVPDTSTKAVVCMSPRVTSQPSLDEPY